jgi:hypothetical protein
VTSWRTRCDCVKTDDHRRAASGTRPRGAVAVSVIDVAVMSVDVATVDGVASRVRASATRATRHVFARNPDWADTHETAGQDVLDEAAEKRHGR